MVCGQTDHVPLDLVVDFDGITWYFQVLNLKGLNVLYGFSFTEFYHAEILELRIIRIDLVLP